MDYIVKKVNELRAGGISQLVEYLSSIHMSGV